jgi:Mrp family chromosome partitioning ATPase
MTKNGSPSESNNHNLLSIPIENKLPEVTTAKQQIRHMQEIKLRSYEELDAAKIIYPAMKDLKNLNTFRGLRTKLLQKAGKKNFSIMISSLISGGGGTYVSQNLAAAIALDFEKTALLVDCNLTNPSSEHFLPAADYGLTDFLDDPSLSVGDIIYATGIPRLRMTPIGSQASNGSEFFSSDRMEDFMKEIKGRYPERYIILDAPPINSSPDARVLADLCDFSILVAPYGRVTKQLITAGINSIPKDKFLGIVFNN